MAKFVDVLDLSDLGVQDYSTFTLKSNPFPSMGLPDDIPATMADRKEIILRFKSALADCVNTGNSSVTVLTGDYGSGKTHLLRYFKYKVNDQLFHLTSKNRVLAIYVKSVGISVVNLFKYFMDDVSRYFLADIAIKEINNYLAQQDETKIKSYIYDKELKTKYNKKTKLDEYLRGSRFYDLFKDIRKEVFAKISSDDFVYALLHLAHPDYSQIAWRWFLCEDLEKDSRKMILLDNNITERQQVLDIFNGVISLLLQSGLKSIVVLIDEFENITQISKTARDRYFDDIRHLLDENRKGVCFVIASTYTGFDAVTQSQSALTRRFARDYKLEKFDLDNINELIKQYLALYRLQNSGLEQKVKTLTDTSVDIYPFTNKAINLIFEKTTGVVHYIIDVCRESIELAIQSNSTVIDEKIIEKIK
ncbi:MAG: BREX system ATP-binding domain-containing protein [Nitrosotalea sp.]